MHGDEIGARQAIAVEEDAKLAGAGTDATIADLAAAKAKMLMADMLDRHRQPRRPAFDDACGFRSRAVLGDDDFEILVRLMRERAQRRFERVVAVIGRDNDRDQRRGVHDLAPARSRSRSRRFLSRNFRIGSAK